MRGVEGQLDGSEAGGVGSGAEPGRDGGDLRGQVEVELRHPLDDVLTPVAVAVHRVEADQLEVDEAVTDGRAEVVADVSDGLGDGRDQGRAGGEVRDGVPRVQALGAACASR